MTRGAFFLLLVTLACFLSPLLGKTLEVSGLETSLDMRFLPPSARNWLGTDELGRDILMRLLAGGQVSLTVGFLTALSVCCLGSAVGMAAGYLGGRWDAALMRLTDLLISLPALPLLILFAAIDLSKLGLTGQGAGAGIFKIVAIISLLGWTGVARLVRTRTLALKNMDYVLAARALGASHMRILLRHIFPGLAPTVRVAGALAVGNAMLAESALSFLGLGIQPPSPSWGNMLSNAQETIWEYPALCFYPGLLILATVLAANSLESAAD